MDGTMLSKSLIQFSLMGAAVFPPCFLPGAKGAADEQVQEGRVELLYIQSRRGSRDEIPLIQVVAVVLCWSSREDIPHVQGKRIQVRR